MRVLFVINRTFFRKICYSERFRPKICVGCQDVVQKAVSFNDIAIASVKGNDYTFCYWCMSKDEVIHLSINTSLSEKSETL